MKSSKSILFFLLPSVQNHILSTKTAMTQPLTPPHHPPSRGSSEGTFKKAQGCSRASTVLSWPGQSPGGPVTHTAGPQPQTGPKSLGWAQVSAFLTSSQETLKQLVWEQAWRTTGQWGRVPARPFMIRFQLVLLSWHSLTSSLCDPMALGHSLSTQYCVLPLLHVSTAAAPLPGQAPTLPLKATYNGTSPVLFPEHRALTPACRSSSLRSRSQGPCLPHLWSRPCINWVLNKRRRQAGARQQLHIISSRCPTTDESQYIHFVCASKSKPPKSLRKHLHLKK